MRRCGNCGREGHNKRTCPYMDKASMKKGNGKTNDVQAFKEAKAILESFEKMEFFNWAQSSNPILEEMKKRLLILRNNLEDGSLRDKLDLMIKRENLERFDVGVKIVEGRSISKV
jgi:hypothetical protein